MTAIIAFISNIRADMQREYLSSLAAAMPDETILPFSELTPEQRDQVRIAVVANPDPAEVAALHNLVWVQSLWAGVEQLVARLPSDGPPIVRLVDPEMSRTMAEAVLAWTHYLQRDMPRYARQQTKGIWRQQAYRKPASMTVGLLGLGALGAAAAARLAHAGFRVIGWSRSAKTLDGIDTFAGDDGLNVVLQQSDIVVSLVPLTAQTRGLLNGDRFGAMKPGAALINFSRGPVVAMTDLLAALEHGHLSHAVLDVFDEEPLPADSPLWRHAGVTVLPHISAPTDYETSAAVIAGNVRAFRETGQVPGNVDLTRGY